ncbi:radical SAM protein [Streptomyces sp. ST2-7A]|uniref:radical SAM protein n=1 Tax=Streptomyces sp. ST2-7A TaxID=2907214 RepID=UPI001F34BE69|nr:radical SAM protein [Streptomyces sp. ST2-7A]MCE7079857.1 radical SAM protein [Streptomyces sp. ST2-7A]
MEKVDTSVPVTVTTDRTLRIKVIDSCGMTCNFCHNEGTAVSVDNRRRSPGPYSGSGASGRVSIYAATNGARFLSAPILPTGEFQNCLDRLRESMGFNEVHLTGGEPTLHPRLPALITVTRQAGYRVSITSNGENGERVLTDCAKAGLGHINFSIFGTTPQELALVQHARFRTSGLASGKINALDRSIRLATDLGLESRANIVLPNRKHVDRVRRLLDKYTPALSVRVLSSLADGQESLDAIDQLINDLGAELESVGLIAGTSGFRMNYRLPGGRPLTVKHIRPTRLPVTCSGCRFNNSTDCEESYYGIRLYRDTSGTFQVGICIQRMDLCLPVEEFLGSDIREEVIRLRTTDHDHLTRSISPGVT